MSFENLRHNTGFTLIELLMVIAIASIIASVAVPSYSRFVQQSTVSTAFGMLQKAKTEVANHYAQTGNFPSNGTSYVDNDEPDADIADVYFYNGPAGTHIVATFGPGSGSSLASKRLWLVADDSNPNRIRWTCTTHFAARLAIPEEALPSECQ